MTDTLRNIFTLCLHCFNPSNLVYSMEQYYRLCKMQFAPFLPALQMNVAVCFDFKQIDQKTLSLLAISAVYKFRSFDSSGY